MNLICDALRRQGIMATPVMQDGVELQLTWNPAQVGPMLEDRVIVLLPDIHLSNDGDGDIFREGDSTRHARFRVFLTALVHARELAMQRGLHCSVLHLGDFYDVWRAYPQYRTHPSADYDVIEHPYADVIDILVKQLDLRVCVGNHDASMGLFPPWWARDERNQPNNRLAYSQRYAGGRLLAFHGHQSDMVQKALETEGDSGVVKAATVLAQRLSNAASLAIQHEIDYLIDAFADPHLSSAEVRGGLWSRSQTITDSAGFHCTLWSDRIHMDHVKTVLEHSDWRDAVRMVFMGHSHRAGISALTLGDRFIPVIDPGSWAWGHTQFGVAVEGEVSLWSLPGG